MCGFRIVDWLAPELAEETVICVYAVVPPKQPGGFTVLQVKVSGHISSMSASVHVFWKWGHMFPFLVTDVLFWEADSRLASQIASQNLLFYIPIK